MNQVLRAMNDNFGGDFEKIPEMFIRVYQAELMDWARRREQLLEIDLWDPPGATVLSAGYQGKVMLRVDAFSHPVTKAMKFVIKPNTEEDERRIRNHCQELPAILTAHKAAAQAAKHSRTTKAARWVFDGTVPDYFVQRYQDELRAWAANLKQIGLTKHIILREGVFSDMSPDEELGAQLIQVELKAKIERIDNDELRIVVSASDDEHERRIKKHCEKLQRKKIPAGMVLVEPPRAGVPFMPDRVT